MLGLYLPCLKWVLCERVSLSPKTTYVHTHMSVMIFGTASHVGKSTITAGILRLLIRRGISCAPFKSQNMSLNSWITEDGEEIGIAQAMQAHAARCNPSALMNPILLKPKGSHSSQIILLGKPYSDITAETYFTITSTFLPHCLTAAQTLIEQYTNLVVEGAGSTAELNLYDRDIANIGIARALQYPIILVADIERGGVFAQVYGTISLLPPDIKPLVKGIIINKFQGDPALFDSGIQILQNLCHVPVLGVLPYAHFDIPDEDSLSLHDKKLKNRYNTNTSIDVEEKMHIAIIKLRYISNFSDFMLLESDPHVSVSYVMPGEDLMIYDAIIIPGTKNTILDLLTLQETGAADAIITAAKQGVVVIGICGGYQMLGCILHDSGVEEQEGAYKGLGLLPCITVFDSYEKVTTQVTRTSSGFGPIFSRIDTVSGYEIHMGKTFPAESLECANDFHSAFEDEGAISNSGLIIGTYLHGLFTNQNAVNALVSYLCEKKGYSYTEPEQTLVDPFDHLADHLERYLDIKEILRHFEY